jgi:hypothetical protein
MIPRLVEMLGLLVTVGGVICHCDSDCAAQESRTEGRTTVRAGPCALQPPPKAHEPRTESRMTVRAADLGKTIALMGRLGKPMTEVVEIKGHWEDRGFTKASRFVFVVSAVAGRPLDSSVEFNRYVVSIDGKAMTDGDVVLDETWTCKAIELGQFRNVMEANWELFYSAPVSPARWGDGPFVSELVLCKRTLVRHRQVK